MVRTIARVRRQAFTFIELLVVVAVIAILIALLLSAVQKVLGLQARTEVLSDITQMQQSLETAKAAYNNIENLPSRLILFNNINNYRNIGSLPPAVQPVARQTKEVLMRMFGKPFIVNNLAATQVVNWGAYVPTDPTSPVYLRGSECLVFYLGGMQDANGRYIGWSNNPLDPTDATTPVKDRRGPYFQFKMNRIVRTSPLRPFEYNDPWGVPYAYFAPSAPNNYNPAAMYPTGLNDDNAHLGLFDAYHQPFAAPAPKNYYNPNLFQIVSAGPDGKKGGGFGQIAPPTNPTPGAVATSGAVEQGAKDNLANFSQTELGNGVE